MAMQEYADQIQSQVSLVKIAAGYISLTESRRIFKGPCPFHKDLTNSLMISPEKNQFKCFGCGVDGGPLEFVMRIKGITLQEAVISLSQDLIITKSA
jgi:DNA primase